MSWVVKPLVSRGTTKPRMPSSVFAHTTATSETPPFVIHIFAPFRTQSRPVALRVGLHRRRVAAGVGLGQAEAADELAGGHARQPALLLLVGAELPDREHRERALDRDEAAQPAVGRLELAARDAVVRRARARAAVAAEVHAEQAELADRRREVARRQRAVLVPLLDVREHAVRGEAPHGLRDEPVLVGEEPLQAERIEGADLRARGGGGHAGEATSASRPPRRGRSGVEDGPRRAARRRVPTAAPESASARTTRRSTTAPMPPVGNTIRSPSRRTHGRVSQSRYGGRHDSAGHPPADG